MKKLAIITTLAATSFFTACGDKEEAAPTAEASTEVKPYPLKVCIVSDEELGSMGDPVSYVHEGQEVKFCCSGCIDDFKDTPAEYLAKLSN